MADFSETRTLPIDGYIINISNLQRIANYVFCEYKKSSENNNNSGRFSITLEREDGVTLNSSSASILNEVATTSESRITSILISYKDYTVGQEISISLRKKSIFSSGSRIDVEGKDRSWVNGQISVLAGIIRGFEPQNAIIKNFRCLWSVLLSIPIGYAWVDMAITIFGNSVWDGSGEISQLFREIPALRFFVIACASAITGIIPSYIIVKGIEEKFWPSVEIQVGPEHSFSEKKRRKRAFWIIFVVIPLIVALAGLLITIISYIS